MCSFFLLMILQISCGDKNVNINACFELNMMLRLHFNPIFVENLVVLHRVPHTLLSALYIIVYNCIGILELIPF